jgi:hypothetical protein
VEVKVKLAKLPCIEAAHTEQMDTRQELGRWGRVLPQHGSQAHQGSGPGGQGQPEETQ